MHLSPPSQPHQWLRLQSFLRQWLFFCVFMLIIAPINCVGSLFLCGFMCVLLFCYSLRPIAQCFSHVGTSRLPVSNQVSC